MYIAICDDEQTSINEIKKYLTRIGTETHYNIKIKEFHSSSDVLSFYRNNGNKFDVLITDIEMPNINGIELANTIRDRDRNVIIFFLTSHTDYAIHCFDALPLNFWVKPIAYETLAKDIRRVHNRMAQVQEYIEIIHGRHTINIKYCDIIYFEKFERKTIVHTKTEDYYTTKSLSILCNELNPTVFVRINQSFIINMEYISEFKEPIIKLKDIPANFSIGRTFLDDFKRRFINFAERRLLK